MITIKVPDNNHNERKYILDIIFEEFLGLKYSLFYTSTDYEIVLENDKILKIKDTFFNKYPNDLEYLKLENIPNKIEELDIFAATFFMLSRWEEYVNTNRDSHNRFPSSESLASKQGFLNRPIINEYIDKLKIMLLELDNKLVFKSYKYKFILTHDVDSIYKWDTIKKFIRNLGGDLIVRKSISEFLKTIFYYTQVKLRLKNDPFDTFDYLMDISDKIGVKSHFFFMGKGLTKFDNMYNSLDNKTKYLVDKIKRRGHFIGIHPTYDAYNNKKQFKKEKNELEFNLNTKMTFGREHFLRFEVPTTWQIWEDCNMEWDSTLSFADREGFRCGICYEFSVYNILTRKKLNLKEKPLIVMETSFLYQDNITPELIKERIVYLINKVKKHNGEFVLLWHNSNFNIKKWDKSKNIYSEILDEC